MSFDWAVSGPAAIASTGAAPVAAASPKPGARTVTTLIASADCTVAKALPAERGRTKVSGDSTATISEICATSSSAAIRGIRFLPIVVAAARTWL